MPLYFFYTMVQKSQKWPKTQIKGGGGGPRKRLVSLCVVRGQRSWEGARQLVRHLSDFLYYLIGANDGCEKTHENGRVPLRLFVTPSCR